MSSAPLERLATRQAQYSKEQGDAEERMLGNLAEIPEMSMRTAERIQKMQLNDAAAQLRTEAVEQKRMEIERRMYEASGLYKLRTEQAMAQSAKVQADAAKFELQQQQYEWQRSIGDRREDRLSSPEQMDDDFFTTPVRMPGKTGWVFRLGNGRTRPAEPEEVEAHQARLKAPGIQNEQREAQAERARRPPAAAAETPGLRVSRASAVLERVEQAIAAAKREVTKDHYAEIDAQYSKVIGAAQEELEAAQDEQKVARQAKSRTMPTEFNGNLNQEQYQSLLDQGLTEPEIRERLRKAGRLK